MSDEKDFLEAMHAESRLRFGKELTPEEAAERFALHSFDARIQHLSNLRRDESLTFNEAAKRFRYERALRSAHEKLRLVGR
jgi:hypothetical protein